MKQIDVIEKNSKKELSNVIKSQHLHFIVDKIYRSILKLPTDLLYKHELQVYKELVSRKDFIESRTLLNHYFVNKNELIKRGVEINDRYR